MKSSVKSFNAQKKVSRRRYFKNDSQYVDRANEKIQMLLESLKSEYLEAKLLNPLINDPTIEIEKEFKQYDTLLGDDLKIARDKLIFIQQVYSDFTSKNLKGVKNLIGNLKNTEAKSRKGGSSFVPLEHNKLLKLLEEDYEKCKDLIPVFNPVEKFKQVILYLDKKEYRTSELAVLKHRHLLAINQQYINEKNRLSSIDNNEIESISSNSRARPNNARPKKQIEELKTKRVCLMLTENKYSKLVEFQKFFGKTTLTGFIDELIDSGLERVVEDFEKIKSTL